MIKAKYDNCKLCLNLILKLAESFKLRSSEFRRKYFLRVIMDNGDVSQHTECPLQGSPPSPMLLNKKHRPCSRNRRERWACPVVCEGEGLIPLPAQLWSVEIIF